MGFGSSLARRRTLASLAVGASVILGFACSSSEATPPNAGTRTNATSGGTSTYADAGGVPEEGAAGPADTGHDAAVDDAHVDCIFPPFSASLTALAAAKRPMNLVVDACHVYWTEQVGGGLWRVSKNGGAVTQLAVSTPPPGTMMISKGLAIDATALTWSEYVGGASGAAGASVLRTGDVVRTLLDGGSSTKIWSGNDASGAIAVDAQYAYVLQRSVLQRVPLDGGATTTLATSQGGWSVTVTPQRVLWTAMDEVHSVPAGGGAPPATFAVGLGEPGTVGTVVTHDGNNLYWGDTTSSDATGRVYARPLAGGPQRVLYRGTIEPLGIAFDATSIYVAGGSGGQILRIAIANGEVTVLASGQGWPYGIAVDDGFVYWANNDGGEHGIMRIAK